MPTLVCHCGLALLERAYSEGRLRPAPSDPSGRVWDTHSFSACYIRRDTGPNELIPATEEARDAFMAFLADPGELVMCWGPGVRPRWADTRIARLRERGAPPTAPHATTTEVLMTQDDVMAVAAMLKRLKPDPNGATVGERLLWGKTVEHIYTALAQRSPRRRWSEEAFFEAAGHAALGPPQPQPAEEEEDVPEDDFDAEP